PKSAATATEQIDARGTVPRVTRALLRIHLLAGTPDLGAVLHLVSAGASLGELPDHAALDEISARLKPEDCVREFDGARLLAFQRRDFQFHVTPLPSAQQTLLRPELSSQAPRRPPAHGTCRVSANLSAPSS